MSRRTSVALGLAVFAAAGWTFLPMSTAHAETTYEAFAQANGVEVVITNPSFPGGIAIEGGGPQAQTRQNSLGTRDANAQFPYAGNTVPGLPGVGAAILGVPAPPYPFIVSTTAGSAPATANYPGVELQAESGESSTLAAATVGEAGTFGARSTSRIDEARNGDVVATASTFVDSLKLGSYGTVSGVRSDASVLADGASGKLTRTTTTSVGRISVPGLNVVLPTQPPGAGTVPAPIPGVPNPPPLQLTPFPVSGGGQTLADPDIGIQNGHFTVTQVVGGKRQTYTLPTEAVLTAFKQVGIGITFQAPEQTSGGIVSGSYRFSYKADSPPDNMVYNGATKVTQSTALVVANVELQPVFGAGTAGVASPTLPDSLAVDPGTAAPVDSAALPSTALGAVPAAGGAAAVPGAAGAADAVNLAVQPGGLVPTGVSVGSGADEIYLAVVLIAALGFLATAGLSLLGVRS